MQRVRLISVTAVVDFAQPSVEANDLRTQITLACGSWQPMCAKPLEEGNGQN